MKKIEQSSGRYTGHKIEEHLLDTTVLPTVVRLDKLSRSTKKARYGVCMVPNSAFAKGGHRLLSKQIGSLAKHRFTYVVFMCTRELQSTRRCCHT